ncbi:hypothetical protein LTR85_001624 [Meristemomyces frigidus]|nr:hypothetical protein LTR85_001624 [Meristemomyces frigidus]
MATGSIGSVDSQQSSRKAQPSEDEAADLWEYQYSEIETEDFYFTLDLTTRVPDGGPLKQASGRAQANTKEANATGNDANSDMQSNATPARGTSSDPLERDENVTAVEAAGLQVLDLHTANPIVKFDDGVYSCSWSTDLGTQFYVSRPGVTKDALRPGNVLDIIGTSQARLLGKPVTLRPRGAPDGDSAQGTAARNAVEVPDDANSEAESTPAPSDFSTLRPGERLIIPRDRYKNKDVDEQASFLERLSAIKLKKGETDIVPVGGVRYYEPPADKTTIRARALAAEPEEPQDVSNQPLPKAKRQKRSKQAEPKQPWQLLKLAKRSYADLGKETKADLDMRLARESEVPAGPTLLLPRSQQSITATADQPVTPQLPYWAHPTVQYDAPSWDVEPVRDDVAMSGSYDSGV